MKKYYILLAVLFFATNVNAKIRPVINDVTPNTPHSALKVPKYTKKDKEKMCKKHGFTKNKCPEKKIPTGPCPYESSYFIKCCPSGYKYIKSECYNKKLVPSADSCLGFYACIKPKIKKEDKEDLVKPKENNIKE